MTMQIFSGYSAWMRRNEKSTRLILAQGNHAYKASLWMRRLDEAKAEVTLLGIMLRLSIMYY